MFIFSEEKRKQLQEERPELSESELTRLLARMWNDLSEKKKVGTVPSPSPPSLSPLLHWASPAAPGTLPVLVLLQGALLPPGHCSWGRLSPGASGHRRAVTQVLVLTLTGAAGPTSFGNPPASETLQGPQAST